MTCLLDHYPAEIQDEFMLGYAQDGHTHLQRSYGHAMPNDGFSGVSLDQFIALSARARSKYGLFADQWIIGGGALYNCNQDLNYWRPIIDSLCDAFESNGVIDTACVGWQLDQLFGAIPGNATIEVIVYIATRLSNKIPLYTHWMNEALAWWKTGGEIWTDQYGSINVMDRFTWWYAMRPYLTGGHHQGDTRAAQTQPREYASSLCDTLDYFNGRTDKGTMGRSIRSGEEKNFKLDLFECSGQDQFDGKTSEDEGDRIAYTLMCTHGFNNSHLDGYGNGCRMPDGWNF